MSHEECPFATPECKYFNGPLGCYTDTHHRIFPRSAYRTPLEKAFRSLSENIVELPRCVHDEIHALEEPPVKPSIEVMRQAVNDERMERLSARVS